MGTSYFENDSREAECCWLIALIKVRRLRLVHFADALPLLTFADALPDRPDGVG
jgi:hypothetical protein